MMWNETIDPAGDETPDLESSGDEYATRFRGPVGEFLLDVQSRALRSMVAQWAGGTVLDVGGGHGQTVKPLLQEGMDVTIMGSCSRAWGRALRYHGDEVEFETGALVRPPFPERSFDVVTSLRQLAHVSVWHDMIAGLSRVARHAVVVDVPLGSTMKHLAVPLYLLKKRVEGNTRPFRVFSLAEVKGVFAAHGFGHTTVVRQFALPMALHRAVGNAPMSRRSEQWMRFAGITGRMGSPAMLLATREPAAVRLGETIGARPSRPESASAPRGV